MRHEELNVGKLVVETGIYDESGGAIIADSATTSSAISSTAAYAASVAVSTGTAYNSSVVTNSSSISVITKSVASLFAYDSSIATNSTTQSTDDTAISIFNSATISDGRAASGVSAMISAGADSYITSMMSLLVSRVSAAANSNPM